MSTALEEALLEWCEARMAFFKASPGVPVSARFPEEIWKRLGNAEHRLMKLAEKLKAKEQP